MARARTVYRCTACGAEHPKWSGRCGECGEWNTLAEEAASAPRRGGGYSGLADGAVLDLARVAPQEAPRIPTGIDELDRALGGGLVRGSVVLIGGDPGIGKSTLLLQACAALAAGTPTLYVTGEESPAQVALRAQRLGLAPAGLRLLAETRLEAILEAARRERAGVLVVDSIQTVHTEALQSAPGSVGQVRECAAELVRLAKGAGCAVFLVGHVTKEGQLAGPRVLEHMVDTVLYFEGDAGGRLRVVRAVKNRFGAVNELGVFAMTDRGLRPVGNPSAIFLSRPEHAAPGSVVTVTREGTRPLLLEVQALVEEAHGGPARRLAVGVDPNRINLLLAVLHRHGGIPLYDRDVFVNVVGGVRVAETAADLAVVAAAVSSLRDRALPRDLVVFGEVGLAGEIRPVPGGPERLREAAKHGFRRAVVPKGNAPRGGIEGLAVAAVTRLAEALERLD
ncbi:DNA repair protein RadA [Inmirania thermothiophila]|uniref:DNA repair protein RadA n=1 Tax=Inmirania thermothiophila TaxID=1750597 RepID=A0A3N1Y8P9_9GAMM|nr:DNA repair protein RadA [Inmirania thermothiophila]ROR35173.1 DNA replication and repair protein RadA [Inmirania thermothiophila]